MIEFASHNMLAVVVVTWPQGRSHVWQIVAVGSINRFEPIHLRVSRGFTSTPSDSCSDDQGGG